jgi:hypothetical protein
MGGKGVEGVLFLGVQSPKSKVQEESLESGGMRMREKVERKSKSFGVN